MLRQRPSFYVTRVIFIMILFNRRKTDPLSQHVSDPPEKDAISEPVAVPARVERVRLSKWGIGTLFVLIGLCLLLFSGQIVLGLAQTSSANTAQQTSAQQSQTPVPQTNSVDATPTQISAPTPTPSPDLPFFTPNNVTAPSLQLPAGHFVIFQNSTHIYIISTTDNSVQQMYTPDYHYNQAVPPLLTPSGQLIYSGSTGLWITDIFDQQPARIATFSSDVVVASMALSQDGKVIAWSTEPANGAGKVSIYAGPLTAPQLVEQQSSLDCPCFRIFAFLRGTDAAADHTLLLTDDRGSNEALQYGLWSLDISQTSPTPLLIMAEDSQQGPLALIPYSNTLLYAPYEGAAPVPTDNSVPSDIAALSYASSLSIAPLNGSALDQNSSQVVLAGKKQQANSAQNQWVTTPTFSPDGHTLAYIEFSSDPQEPYDRHSAIYTVQFSGSGSQMQVSHPHLVSTSTTKLLELGPWLNSHVVTLYGDESIYALDVQSRALTLLTHPGSYVRILATLGTGLT